jgi:hypothetical protein
MLKLITITINNLLKEENKMYGKSHCTPINEFVYRLFCETKIPRSLINRQEFFGKGFLPGFWETCKVKKRQMGV